MLHREMQKSPRCHAHIEYSRRLTIYCINLKDVGSMVDFLANTLHHFKEERGLLVVGGVCLLSLFRKVVVAGSVIPSLLKNYYQTLRNILLLVTKVTFSLKSINVRKLGTLSKM